MVNKRNTLGRGLGSLLNVSENKDENKFFDEIDINDITINKDQPREYFNEEKLSELSLSIKKHGIIQPVTVRKINDNKYQLISGERRYRASKLSGLTKIPAFIRNNNDDNLLEIALIENIQRENLNSLEIAISYKKLIDELKIKQEELGERVGKNRTTINNYLRLLKLPPSIQKGIKESKIQMGHARSLIAIEKSDVQLKIYHLILKNKLSVRKTEELVRNLNTKKLGNLKKNIKNNEIIKLESKLSSFFGTKITTKGDEKSGKIIVPYKSTNDLNRILELLDII
mgnify:FL=1|tara:strand:- start:5471 stop:6325 length:855 start_codon:yes stop_codon:yes gene_type:complete